MEFGGAPLGCWDNDLAFKSWFYLDFSYLYERSVLAAPKELILFLSEDVRRVFAASCAAKFLY